jgi:hypothetical protein
MPDFTEQLNAIAKLRERCRQQEESLYATRLALQKASQRLGRAQQEQTERRDDRDAEIARRRSQIAQLTARLGSLREEARAIDRWLSDLAEEERLIEHLQRNLAAARSRAGQRRRDLADLRHQDPPPADDIRRLEAELARLERVQGDLSESIDDRNAALRERRERERTQRADQAALQERMTAAREELRGRHAELTDLLRPAFDDAGAVRDRIRELEAAAARLDGESRGCRAELSAAIDGLYENPHPRQALSKLDDRVPFLLFPVRLETIFVPVTSPDGAGANELWVRIYPDDIAVQTHEPVLTDREVAAGELYWVELLVAEHLREERDRRRQAAWRHLVELFGGNRGAWVARSTKPSDWASLAAAAADPLIDFLDAADPQFFDALRALPLDEGTRTQLETSIAAHDGDAFARLSDAQGWGDRANAAARTRITGFPVHALTKTDAWSRAPRTHVMPDRFVLLLYASATAAPREIPGALVSDTVWLGPDPLDAGKGFTEKDGALTFAGQFGWMSDFDTAVAQGLGFRVRLSDQEARDGFARIVVLGAFLSADADAGKSLLEELIQGHQFSPDGFSLVPQGTPTNNTERDGTGYSDNDPFDDLAFFTELDPPAFDPASDDPRRSRTDGRLLADALGISYVPLQSVRHAGGTDILEATAMSTALFPCTLGYWLRTWMAPVVTAGAAQRTRTFFTRFVTGRGPLPAIRVGNQPYGILVTSDLSRWKYPPPDGQFALIRPYEAEAAFLTSLHGLLARLDTTWSRLADALPFVGKPGTDSSDVLMNVLGLHPTSVEFFQRIGYSDEYLRNMDSFKDRARYASELASLIRSMPATARLYLQDLGFAADLGAVGTMRSLHVLWQHYVTSLDAPNLIQNTPLSETQPLAVNYITWLANAETTSTIIAEQVEGPKPTSLLYIMLRNALLLQLHHGAYEWLVERSTFEPALAQSVRVTTLPGVREAAPTLSKLEIMTARVEAAEPAHPSPGTTVADWIWRGPDPAEAEAAFVREQRAALRVLAGTPTARLERCFVEHLDCCAYRLDAWETALFTERLQAHRALNQYQDRQTGVYLGAFGWVEHVTPARKTFLRREELPASLQPADTRPVLDEDDVVTAGPVRPGTRQGGFMHAPSINHASAAAILRSAYLSHASPERAEMFSVNLSSERVRRAQFVLEGMRNGQPVEALLGYQFERGLHDRTSESAARGDVPVVELNEFILPYREAFPFESREIVQAGTGVATETVPAYSVVNGLKLTAAVLSTANGFGLAAVLPAAQRPDATQGAAIVAERDALLDTLDAVKDLLMAENAYQLVQGNFDRVAAVSLAQKDARVPPALEVLDTPRGTEFTFTNRLTLHFDDLDPSVPSSNPWPAIPLTPRAAAEPGLNRWLGTVLGEAPDIVRCEAYRIERAEDGTETTFDRHQVSLADLEVQPIDFVWMAGVTFEGTGGATELETRIAYRYRRAHGIGMDQSVRIEFNPAVAPGRTTFARLFALARHLRALLAENRSLGARDFLPAAGGKATTIAVDKNNRDGYDAGELRSRVQSTLNRLTALADAIDGPSAPPVTLVFVNDPDNPLDDVTFTGTLGAAFAKLEDVKHQFTDDKAVTVSVLVAHAEALHRTLQAVADFGVSDAFPPEADLTTDAAKAALLARAHRIARRLRGAGVKDGIIDRASARLGEATADKTIDDQVAILLETGSILFGETFKYLPAFTCHNEIDVATADAARAQLLAHALGLTPGITAKDVVDEWIQGLARVRPRVHRWEVVRALAGALNDVDLDMRPVQVPYRAKDSWLAVDFPATDPLDPARAFGISRDTVSVTAHGAAAFQAGTSQRGLLLDEWTEEIPTSREITGIAFRFNQPNAAPPQTLLLAITPEETGSWSWDDLVGTLADTLARAKRRAVEPAQLEQQGLVWNAFAPALVSEFSTIAAADVSLDLMTMLAYAPLNDFYAARISR